MTEIGEVEMLEEEILCEGPVFCAVFFLWLGLMPSAIGAIVKDDFFALVESGDIAEITECVPLSKYGKEKVPYGSFWGIS